MTNLKFRKFIAIIFMIVFAFIGLTTLHNIDNIINVVGIEQSQLHENNNFLQNVDLTNLFMFSETYILFYILGTILIIISLIYWWNENENTTRTRNRDVREIYQRKGQRTERIS